MKYFLSFLILLLLLTGCYNEEFAEPTPTPLPDVTFTEYQQIETNRAISWQYFSMNDEHFLALADYRDETLSYCSDSYIYIWNGYTFSLYQTIGTCGATDWEFFTINTDNYLVIANSRDGATYSVNSIIYKWDATEEEFVFFQDIATTGARDWEYFSIDNEHFLALANTYDGSTYVLDSEIYKWNGSGFLPWQTIGTNGAKAWEFFTIDNEHYLAVANNYNDSVYSLDSIIYKWDDFEAEFVSYQDIGTIGALHWKYFTMDSEHYLVCANNDNGTTKNVDSRIYKWDTNAQNFAFFQSIATNGACGWEYFTISDQYFLAVANDNNDTTTTLNSIIYKWDENSETFTDHQAIETSGGHYWEYFNIESKHFLVIANFWDDAQSFPLNSKIFLYE